MTSNERAPTSGGWLFPVVSTPGPSGSPPAEDTGRFNAPTPAQRRNQLTSIRASFCAPSKTFRATCGPPRKPASLLYNTGQHPRWEPSWEPSALDCCDQLWTHMDMEAFVPGCVDGCGRPGTPLGDLRIRRLGVRILPSAPLAKTLRMPQVARFGRQGHPVSRVRTQRRYLPLTAGKCCVGGWGWHIDGPADQP